MKTLKMLVMISLFFTLVIGFAVPEAAALEIGVTWSGKSSMPPKVLAGLEEELKQIAPQAKLDIRKEVPSKEFASVIAEFDKTKDAMVVLRSNGARFLLKNPTNIPTFIGGCNHPGNIGIIKNIDAPEGNITGVTYFVPFETEFEVFSRVVPDIKSVLLIVEKGHASSPLEQEGTRKACEKLGISYSERICATGEEAAQTAAEFSGKVSAIIIGTQAKLAENTQAIVKSAGNTPVLAFWRQPVTLGALAGVAANDVALGRMLAHSVVDVVVNGKAISEVPVKFDPDPELFINITTTQKIGLEIPYDILSIAKIIE